MTIKCIPIHHLVEHTFVLSRDEAKAQINTLLKRHKRVRYMWIPLKDAIVVVTNEPESSFYGQVSQSGATAEKVASRDKFEPFLDFYRNNFIWVRLWLRHRHH